MIRQQRSFLQHPRIQVDKTRITTGIWIGNQPPDRDATQLCMEHAMHKVQYLWILVGRWQNFARDPGGCRSTAFSVTSGAMSPGHPRASQTCFMRITAFRQDFAKHSRKFLCHAPSKGLRSLLSRVSGIGHVSGFMGTSWNTYRKAFFFPFCRWGMWCTGSSLRKSTSVARLALQ